MVNNGGKKRIKLWAFKVKKKKNFFSYQLASQLFILDIHHPNSVLNYIISMYMKQKSNFPQREQQIQLKFNSS